MRDMLLFCAVMAAVVHSAGCTATSWTSMRSSARALADKKGSPPTVEQRAEQPSAPPKADRSPFVAERERSSSRPATDKPAGESTVKADSRTLPGETLQLIAEELRDATPEERDQWYEQLKRVDPAIIPEILRARRMSLEIAGKDTASDDSALWSKPAAGIRQTGHGTSAPEASNLPAADSQSPQGVSPIVAQAVHRKNPAGNDSGVVLQGFEAEAPIATGTPLTAPSGASQRSSASDQRGYSPPEFAAPAVPWPPQKTPHASPPKSNLSPPLAFGAGLMQNVVGLVPNRNGNSASTPQSSLPAVTDVNLAEWQAELARSIALLEQELASQKPGPASDDAVQKHVALRLLYLLTNHQERALTAIPGLDPAEQEFWQQFLWGLSNSLDARHIPRSEDRATQTVAQLNSAIRRLQEKADLQVRNVTFSRQNFGYGSYERFAQNEVRPGQEVLLYAEIDNFKSEPTADGQYRTLLRSSIEILSPAGEVRKRIDFPATEDLCRNYRRDYFHNYQFTIPDRLPLGPHVLKLSVFDELNGKMATCSLNFLVN